jgi:alkyl sulfatase BDS1-like metallo-beta-lactamase superfamily hydrolase
VSIIKLQQDMEKFTNKSKEIVFEEISQGYYFVRTFGNVGVVVTNDGVVVIDSSLSPAQAEGVLAKIKEVTEQPVKYLIYTHGHVDHVGGAKVFTREGAKVIAHRNVNSRLDKYKELDKYHYLINTRQFATNFQQGEMMSHFKSPDIVFDQEYVFQLGGKTFNLIHGKGETDDHCIIHIPEDDVVFSGDFIIRSFPNVGNPAKDRRYAKEWAEMMDKIRDLDPKIVFPGHGAAITDKKELELVTSGFKEIMQHVHKSVVKCLNEDKSLDEILEIIKLPKHLEANPYLQQFYGCLDFAIRGTYRRYTGWYDGNPTNLFPESVSTVTKEIRGLIEDEEKIINKAITLIDQNQHRLALHIIDLIILSEGEKLQEAMKIKSQILNHLSTIDDNYMRKNIFANASDELQKKLS